MGSDYSVIHAATLVVNLPRESRVSIKLNPDNAWGITEQLLSMIEYHTHSTWYQNSKDAKSGRNKPKQVFVPKKKNKDVEVFTIDEYKRRLSLARKEVTSGN